MCGQPYIWAAHVRAPYVPVAYIWAAHVWATYVWQAHVRTAYVREAYVWEAYVREAHVWEAERGHIRQDMVSQRLNSVLKARQRLGKYLIRSRLAEGGFASVYKATDTIAGFSVALKIPHPDLMRTETLETFRREVRLTARLDHPNILPIKDAGFVDGLFVIASPLGEQTLGDRVQKRMTNQTVICLAQQMLGALAHAHKKGVIHCDIKPENFILFPENQIRLADFGIAKVARRTVKASGSGTVGYIAPEQAMGKPSMRSDVFSLGLVLYRMFSGRLPEWPFEWPPPGFDRVRKSLHPDLVRFLQKCLQVDDRKRFHDAGRMQTAFDRLRPHALRSAAALRRRRRAKITTGNWKTIQRREFKRAFGKILQTRYRCTSCDGPVSEAMRLCPWCGRDRLRHRGDTRFPCRCPRCRRGAKKDWRFCAWCYGASISDADCQRYTDVCYSAKCANSSCRGPLLPFVRYCPWCRHKVGRKWKIEGSKSSCKRCGWGVLPEYWEHCPWCAKNLRKA